MQCEGMADAMAAVDGVVYEGEIAIPLYNDLSHVVTIQDVVNDRGGF